MKFGISQIHEEIYCENCKKLLSKEGFCNDDYCSRCGAPLNGLAVDEYVKHEEEIKKSVVEELDKIFSENENQSFKEVMCKYLEK